MEKSKGERVRERERMDREKGRGWRCGMGWGEVEMGKGGVGQDRGWDREEKGREKKGRQKE